MNLPPTADTALSEPAPSHAAPPVMALSRPALRRLRQVWRSAGWPFQDLLEAELLAGGWLERRWDQDQRVTVHLTPRGITALSRGVQAERQRYHAHEALIDQVVQHLQAQGRVVWRGMALRAKPRGAERGPTADGREVDLPWMLAIPDVFSIRHTSRPERLAPLAHEIKVSRGDLLSDLRKPLKGASYRAAAGACWYVFPHDIADPAEIPTDYGVMVQEASGALVVARPAPRLHQTLPFSTWMALARATPCAVEETANLGETLGICADPYP